MTEVKLTLDYDEHEAKTTIDSKLAELANSPEASSLTSLIIGDWGGAYEENSSIVVKSLIQHKHSFPNLKKLFIGDMESEECEVSWINQSDLSPLLIEFPELTSLTIKGGTGLALTDANHDKLEELIIITGGLCKSVLKEISEGQLPNLQKLELYLGVEDYGFDGGLEDVLPLVLPGKFPKLTYLGLKNSEIQDEIAIALADAPILDQLETLDLSMGTLSDLGGKALFASARVRKLKKIDLSYHYMSQEIVAQLESMGIETDIGESEDSDDDDDWRSPALTE